MEKFILEIPGAISKDICEDIIKRFDSDNRKRIGEVVMNGNPIVMPEIKNSRELVITPLAEWKDIDTHVSNSIKKHISDYRKFLKYGFPYDDEKQHPIFHILDMSRKTYDRYLQIQNTPCGGAYNWHADSRFKQNIEENTLAEVGFINCIIYLNTLDYNEGGCTEFINGKKIKPEVGKMVFWPTNWIFVHRGEEVKCERGKYAIVTQILFNAK